MTTLASSAHKPSSGSEDVHVRIDTEWLQQLPLDLYVPPSAFEVLLDRFEGPLDFLLYLVRKTGFNLLDVDIAPIASQYLQYIEEMKTRDIELASEYMVMAALLADLKSRLLLPKPESAPPDENDPRLNLLARLEAYAEIKSGATHLDDCEILERDTFSISISLPADMPITVSERFSVDILHKALQQLLNKPATQIHQVHQEPIILEVRIDAIRLAIQDGAAHSFYRLLNPQQGRLGIVVSFMAVLELIRLGEISVISNENNLIIQQRNTTQLAT